MKPTETTDRLKAEALEKITQGSFCPGDRITFEFTTRDDCLDKMVPSDLRQLVAERDEALKAIESAWFEACHTVSDINAEESVDAWHKSNAKKVMEE